MVGIVKKISNATSYLHEFGFCHSNISSHSILIGENTRHIKLSSFELAVPYKSEVQSEVETKTLKKLMKTVTPSKNNGENNSSDHLMSNEQTIEKYKQLSKTASSQNHPIDSISYRIPFLREANTEYLPYCIEYRRHFAIYNYQAPELLSHDEEFVFPSKQTDTYGIILLLWELLNKCIPFVIYNEEEHRELLKINYPLKFLPIIEEKRCQRFHGIFEQGLKREPETRIDFEKITKKLDAIETDIHVENDKTQTKAKSKCSCSKVKSNKKMPRQSLNETSKDSNMEKATPDRSSIRRTSILPSPGNSLPNKSAEKKFSPLNNGNTAACNRSMLDFHKLLSPRRGAANEDAYQRNSTLKKRKKLTPTNQSKQSVRDLFAEPATADDMLKESFINREDSIKSYGNVIYEHETNEFNNAHTKSAIYRELDFTNDEENPSDKNANIEMKLNESKNNQLNNRIQLNDESNVSKPNNSSYEFVIDDYALPKEIIARNNKIRRCTWLSSDQVNNTSQAIDSKAVVVATKMHDKCDEQCDSMSALNNNSKENNKKVNVNIKIVHTQLSPMNSINQNDSMKSDCSMASDIGASSEEESFSVKSRIKFFRSLESQSVQRRTPNRNRANISRRSDISYNEAKKAVLKSQRNTYPPSAATENNTYKQNLLNEISQITADIQKNLSKNKYLNEKKDQMQLSTADQLNNLKNIDFNDNGESVAFLIDDILQQGKIITEDSEHESSAEDEEKRNSVRETVQKFETSMKNDKNGIRPGRKIANKLLNSKIFNIEPKTDVSNKSKQLHGNDRGIVTDEKIEEVMRVEEPSETENESGSKLVLYSNNENKNTLNGELV